MFNNIYKTEFETFYEEFLDSLRRKEQYHIDKDENGVTLKFELPGIPKDKIKVKVHGQFQHSLKYHSKELL